MNVMSTPVAEVFHPVLLFVLSPVGNRAIKPPLSAASHQREKSNIEYMDKLAPCNANTNGTVSPLCPAAFAFCGTYTRYSRKRPPRGKLLYSTPSVA